MKMLISCFGTKIKQCKTIYILKGYTDSYSDGIYKLAHTFFKMVVAIYATCDFFPNKFVWTFLTDLLTRFC